MSHGSACRMQHTANTLLVHKVGLMVIARSLALCLRLCLRAWLTGSSLSWDWFLLLPGSLELDFTHTVTCVVFVQSSDADMADRKMEREGEGERGYLRQVEETARQLRQSKEGTSDASKQGEVY